MPDREKIKKFITNLLLIYVLVTIGFSLGRHSVLNRVKSNTTTTSSDKGSLVESKVVKVFYMHSTFRCVTCNDVEARALDLVTKEFAEARNNQTLLWEDINFQENTVLAKQFDVIASCIVVSIIDKGQIVDFVRLDDVWTLLEKPEEFNAYVRKALSDALSKISGE